MKTMPHSTIQAQMRLGEALQITISSKNIEKSLEFYTRLGFRIISRSDASPSWARITDESIVLFFVEEADSFIGLTYFCENVNERVSILEDKGVVFSHKEGNDYKLSQAILWNINKVGVAIVNAPPETVYIPSLKSKALCGRFAELSLQTTNFDEDLEKWVLLGFHVISARYEPVKSALLTDDLIMIGLHETNNWQQPSFVYTQKDMGKSIQKLIDNGLEPAFIINDNLGNIMNAGVMAPEGTGFFFLES